MISLQEYTKNQYHYLDYVNECLNANKQIVNPNELLIEHGKDIDNVLYKFQYYTNNHLNSRINESKNNFYFTVNESNAVRDMFILLCEEYKAQLEKELTICECLLNDTNIDDISINEVTIEEKFQLMQKLKTIYGTAKQNIKAGVDEVKTKIKEVKQIITDFANKTIKSVKEMAVKLIDLLSKFNCTIKGLYEKLDWDVEKGEEEWNKLSEDIVNNIDRLKKNNVYESYGNQLKMISEADEIDQSNTVDQKVNKPTTKELLWNAFKQFMVWAAVCIVIPGTVCAIFPGTFLALLVPLACKLAWNGYKIKKMWDQWKKVKEEWPNYSKVNKYITVFGMVASIIALAWNFGGLAKDGGTVVSGFIKSGGKLLEKANLGVQPDILTRGFAAFVKMLSEKKFNFEDFFKAFKEITSSFAEHTQLVVENAVKGAGKVGQTAEDVMNKFNGEKFKSSYEAWKKLLWPNSIPNDKIPDGSKITVAFDGVLKSKKAAGMVKWFNDHGFNLEDHLVDGFNKGLNKMCKNAGSVYAIKDMPAELWKEFLNSGVKAGHNGISAVLGAVTGAVGVEKIIKNVVKAASSMLMTLPIINVTPENGGGFQVRLGKKGEKNYVYEIKEDGVKEELTKEDKQEFIKKRQKFNDEYLKQLKDSSEDSENDKVEKNYEKAKKQFSSDIDKQKGIIFYGIKTEVNESVHISLQDYIIEAKEVSIQDLKDNVQDLKKYFVKEIKEAYDKIKKEKGEVKDFSIDKVEDLLDKMFNFTPKLEFNNTSISFDHQLNNDHFTKGDMNMIAVILREYVFKEEKNRFNTDYWFNILKSVILFNKLLKECYDKDEHITKEAKSIWQSSVINLLKESNKFKKDIKDEKFTPIEFDVSNKDDEAAKEKTQELSDKVNYDKKEQEKVEDELKNKGVLPDQSKEKETESSDKDKKSEDSNDKEEKQIFAITPDLYVHDISDANKKGPRKDKFPLKGIFSNYEFITITDGLTQKKLEDMLGKILYNMINNLYNTVSEKPCIKNGDKFEMDENQKANANDERDDYGKFTNIEITDILNNPDNAKKYLSSKTGKVSAAQTKKEKEQLQELQEIDGKAIKDDEEAMKAAKAINLKITDDKGNINDRELNRTIYTLSEYQLSKHKDKSSKGFFTKIWGAIKSFFGMDKEDTEKYDKLDKAVVNYRNKNKETNESLLDNMHYIRTISLQDYIKENLQKGIH